MGVKASNNAFSTLAAGTTAISTTITLATGTGSRFPVLTATDWFYGTLINATNQLEIVKCTAISGDVMTVVRGADGSTARIYSLGDKFELRPVAAMFGEKIDTTAVIAVANGGTGATAAATALTNLGGAALAGAAFIGPISTTGNVTASGTMTCNGNAFVGRLDTASEGGRLWFGRALDNAFNSYLQVYGATATPALRYVTGAGQVFAVDSAGNVTASASINGTVGNFSGNVSGAAANFSAGLTTTTANFTGQTITVGAAGEGDLALGSSGGYFYGTSGDCGWYKAAIGKPISWSTTSGDVAMPGNLQVSKTIFVTASAANPGTLLDIANTSTNGAQIKMTGNGAVTPKKTIRVLNGNLEVVNDAYSAVVFSVQDNGGTTMNGGASVNNGALQVNNGEVIGVSSTTPGQFRAIYGNYGVMLRNDGGNVYLLQTASGTPQGNFNGYRPFSWNLSNGAVSLDGTGVGVTCGGAVSAQSVIAAGVGIPLTVNSTNSTYIKVALQETGITRGFISASATVAFGAVNAANTITCIATDNSGNFTAAGNVTAYSDERLKANWRGIAPTFIESLAKIKSGIYDRTDIGETQVGVSAQALQAILPEAVQVGTDANQTLSVAYGNAALLACVELAKRVLSLEAEITRIKNV